MTEPSPDQPELAAAQAQWAESSRRTARWLRLEAWLQLIQLVLVAVPVLLLLGFGLWIAWLIIF